MLTVEQLLRDLQNQPEKNLANQIPAFHDAIAQAQSVNGVDANLLSQTRKLMVADFYASQIGPLLVNLEKGSWDCFENESGKFRCFQ